ncbi:MAG TPA: S41 family peptidase [Trebonia sp.]|jgi:C-terminal processing protease CtpA/Prc|nr:S41 family peptidase [Trebonia sp.]
MNDAGTDPVEALLKLLCEHYIFPDRAEQAAASVRERNIAGDYRGLSEPVLAVLLTDHLFEICHDKHLRVGVRTARDDQQGDAEERCRTRLRRERQLANHGIARVERLPGNIGLIDLRSIPDPADAARSIAAAMDLVAHTDALIFDLRQNLGGWPEGVIFWNSYLFPDGDTLLNTIEHRGHGGPRQYWSLAAVPGDRYLDRPVYVLTSHATFSGGEEFAYNLKTQQRATLIGEVTGGGAHPVDNFEVTATLQARIPVARSVNPVTGTNWEGTGVEPDVEVPADQAFEHAYRAALDHVLATQTAEPVLAEAREILRRRGRHGR